jgi:hypothetical protein
MPDIVPSTLVENFDTYGGYEIEQGGSEGLCWLSLIEADGDVSETLVNSAVLSPVGIVQGVTSVCLGAGDSIERHGVFDLTADGRITADDYICLTAWLSGAPSGDQVIQVAFADAVARTELFSFVPVAGWNYVVVKRSSLVHTSGFNWAGVRSIFMNTAGTGVTAVYLDDLRIVKADPDDATTFNDTGRAWDFGGSSPLVFDSEVSDPLNLISGYDGVTGVALTNSDSGVLYFQIMQDAYTVWYAKFFRDAACTQFVGYAGGLIVSGTAAIHPMNGSGLGGTLDVIVGTVVNVPIVASWSMMLGVWHIYQDVVNVLDALGQIRSTASARYTALRTGDAALSNHFAAGVLLRAAGACGLLAFAIDGDNCYEIKIDSAASTVSLIAWVAGVATVLGAAAATFALNTAYYIGLLRDGPLLWVCVSESGDAFSLFSAAARKLLISDSTYLIGRLGLVSYGVNSRFFHVRAGSPEHTVSAEFAFNADLLDGHHASELVAGSASHDATYLRLDAANLSAFAVQATHTSLMGPISGAAAAPTFRIRAAAEGGSSAWINVRDYGTDDAAVTTALSVLKALGRGTLYFSGGSAYNTTGGFTLDFPCTVRGDGNSSVYDDTTDCVSKVNCSSATANLFNVTSPGCSFRDIVLNNTAATEPSAGAGIAVAAGCGDLMHYDRVTVYGFYNNIDHDGAQWTMNGCYLAAPVNWALRTRNTVNVDFGDYSISNTVFLAAVRNAAAAIRIESGGGVQMTNCKFNGSPGFYLFNYSIDLTVVANVTTVDFQVANCSIENYITSGIHVRTDSTKPSKWTNFTINENEFGAFAVESTHAIDMQANALHDLGDVVISGNIFADPRSPATAAINLVNVNNVRIHGNILSDEYGTYAALLAQSGCTNVVTDSSISATGGSREVLMAPGVTPPEPILTPDGKDWIYVEV